MRVVLLISLSPNQLKRNVMDKIVADDEKLQELILLISESSQNDEKFGAVKLNKLLFHCDFSAFLTFETPITGQEYFALPAGPAPKKLKPIIMRMEKQGDLAVKNVQYYGNTQKRSIPLRPPDLSVFSQDELHLIHRTILKFWGKSATEISEESHGFLGWKTAKHMETIPYSTALVSSRPPTEEEKEYGRNLVEGTPSV